MDKLQLVFFVFSFVFFCIAAWQHNQPYYNRLIALGLTFFVAAFIFGGAMKVFAT